MQGTVSLNRENSMLKVSLSSFRNDKRGVTLVEVLIALVVLLIVFMGLLQASLLTLDVNMRNEIRDEAVRISSEYMTRTKTANFASWTSTGDLPSVVPSTGFIIQAIPRQFRNTWTTFTVERSIGVLDANNRKVGIRVSWTYRNEPFNHSILSSMRAQ